MSTPEAKFEYWNGLTLVGLAKELKRIQGEADVLKDALAILNKDINTLSVGIIPEMMADQEITTMNIDDVGRLQTRADAWVSVLAANKAEFLEWCVESGNEPLIKSDVHPQTLKAFIKGRVKEGKEYPQHLVKFEAYEKAVIVKVPK